MQSARWIAHRYRSGDQLRELCQTVVAVAGRTVLASQFTQRRDLLKARSALLALNLLLHRDPHRGAHPGATDIAAEVERILASTHEFAELRLLATLRSRVTLPDSERVEAARVVVRSCEGLLACLPPQVRPTGRRPS